MAACLVSNCDSELRQCLSSGGSALPASTLTRLRPKLPPSCEIKEGYGMTEVQTYICGVHPIHNTLQLCYTYTLVGCRYRSCAGPKQGTLLSLALLGDSSLMLRHAWWTRTLGTSALQNKDDL